MGLNREWLSCVRRTPYVMERLFLRVFAIALLFSSCGEDHETSSSFTFDGTDYEISKGYVRYNENFNEWRVFLVSGGVNYDVDKNNFTGTGNGAQVLIYAQNTDNDDLPAGTYFNSQGNALWASLFINCDPSSGAGCSYSMTHLNVSVIIKKSGNAYDITMSGGGSKLLYKGKLTEY